MRRLLLAAPALLLLRGDMYPDAGNAKLPEARANIGAGAGGGYNIVKDFGADPTGVADSAPAIQAAVDAAAGAPVYMPVGQYRMCSAVTSNIPMHIAGMGRGSGPGPASQSNSSVSQILLCNNNQNGFVVTSIYPSYFHDFQMNVSPSARPMISGYGIELNGAESVSSTVANSVIERVGFTYVWNPIHMVRPSWSTIQNNYFDSWGGHAISCVTTTGIESGCGWISHNFFYGTNGSLTEGSAIYSEAGYIDIHDNEILSGASNIDIQAKNFAAGFIKIHDNTIENCSNFCISVKSLDGSAAEYLQIKNNEFSTLTTGANYNAGIVVQEYLSGGVAQHWIGDIHITGNVFRDTTSNAGQKYIWLQSGDRMIVANNIIRELGANNPFAIVVNGVTSNAGFTAPIMVHDNIIFGTSNKYAFNSTTPAQLRDTTGMSLAAVPAGIANGSQVFVTNADPASTPCTAVGAQSGSMATRQNGAWKCF